MRLQRGKLHHSRNLIETVMLRTGRASRPLRTELDHPSARGAWTDRLVPSVPTLCG